MTKKRGIVLSVLPYTRGAKIYGVAENRITLPSSRGRACQQWYSMVEEKSCVQSNTGLVI